MSGATRGGPSRRCSARSTWRTTTAGGSNPSRSATADGVGWLFAGTGLRPGSQFGRYGIEIDATTPFSPPGTQVLATIPDLLGPGRTAEMTYYETPNGAAVFSAGVLNFGGTVMLWRETQQMLDNLWARLAPG